MADCKLSISFALMLLFTFSGCRKQDISSAKSVLSFDILAAGNKSISTDIHGVINNDTITFFVAIDTLKTQLIPTIQVSGGARISPASNEKTDFSQPVTYTVTAANGTVKQYVVICVPYKVYAFLLKDLQINGAECGFDSSSATYYFPVSAAAPVHSLKINFDTTWVKSVSFGGVVAKNDQTVSYDLVVNQEVDLEAINEQGSTKSYHLITTGLPMVSISVGQTVGNDPVNALLSLTDPDYVAHNGNWFVKSNITMKVRGNIARTFPKKAWAVKTTEADQSDRDVSLLGLRDDNSWILDAMYVDQAKMRNRLCTDIWNSMNNVPYLSSEPDAFNGTHGYMTEVFLDHAYWGVYCLTEDLDRKQLKIKKSYGEMYKADGWTNETQFLGVSDYDNHADWGTWEFEYPDLNDDRSPDWKYLYDIVNFVANSTDEQFAGKIADSVYLDNIADYLIFINATAAMDNTAKNAYFSFYDYRKDNKFFYTPWDLDATFGRDFAGSYYQQSDFSFLGLNNNLFKRLLSVNPGNFVSSLKSRWNTLKNNQLSKSTVNTRIEAYKNQLMSSGAAAREIARWQNTTQDFDTEAEYMSSWYSSHYDALDSYINNLTEF